MQNTVISIRTTSLYMSQPSPVVFGCKTADFGPELQVSMGPRPHQSFVHEKQRDLQRNDKSLLVQDPPVVFACKTATSGPE